MKRVIVLSLLFVQYSLCSQNVAFSERPPVFSGCENEVFSELKSCFSTKVHEFIHANFKVPVKVAEDLYKGEVSVVFEVDEKGKFKVVYTNAAYKELEDEVARVFSMFPEIQPATYNGQPTFSQYTIVIDIPLNGRGVSAQSVTKTNTILALEKLSESEYENINNYLDKFTNEAYKSRLNIPFVHSEYARFDRNMNRVGTNSHTASKPFLYEDVSRYYDFEKEKGALKKDKQSWAGKKLWNEHMVQLQGKDYWFTIDPILDLQVGRDTEADFGTTYNNTRGFLVQGGLGKNLNFYTSVFESQG